MKAIDLIRRAMETSAQFTPRFFEDMRDEPLTQPTPHGGNHTLWVMGHLACSEGALCAMIDGSPCPYEQWWPLFGRGTEPTTDADQYPSFDEVFAAYREVRAATLQRLADMDDADLDRTPKAVPPELAEHFPTIADILLLLPTHENFHIGQVADARRAAGRSPLLESPEMAQTS